MSGVLDLLPPPVRQQLEQLLSKNKTAEAADLLNNVGAQERDASRARTILLEALRLRPEHFETLANLALIDAEDASVTKEIKLQRVRKALEANALWFAGKKIEASLLDDIGKEQESIESYRRAVDLSPSDVDCLYDFALVLSKAGSLDEAITVAKRAIRIDGKHAPANCLLAELLWRSGRSQPKEVVHFAMKALNNPDVDVATKMSACLVAATALEQSEDLTGAVRCFEIASTLSGKIVASSVSAVLVRLATLHSRMGNEDLARQCIKKIACSKEDFYGRRLLDAILGLPSIDSEVVPSVVECSPLCETFISNSRLDDARFLVNKAQLYVCLVTKNITDVCPESKLVKTKADCVDAMTKWIQLDGCQLVFLKDPAVQRGQGIHIFNEKTMCEVKDELFDGKRALLLQKAIHPPHLLDGRKYGLRVHAIVNTYPRERLLSVFVFEDAILTKCWLPYSVDATDALTHISSTSVQRSVEGFDREKSKGLASAMLGDLFSGEFLNKVRNKVFAACNAVGTRMHDCTRDRVMPSFQLFGFDILVRDDMEPFVAEANASPQFQDAKRSKELKENFAAPMMNGVGAILRSGFENRTSFSKSSDGFDHWVFAGDIVQV